MAIYSTTAAGAQDGHAVLGVWVNDTDPFIAFGAGGIIAAGFQFVLHEEFDAEGRPLDPALVYPSLDLTMTSRAVDFGAVDGFPVEVSFVPEAAPAPYSALLPPTGRGEVVLVADTWPEPDTSVTVTVPTVLMAEYMRSSSWNGIISLTVVVETFVFTTLQIHTAESLTPTLAPSISTTEVPFHTGEWAGPAFGRRARTRHCPRTGMPVASDHMTRDGYVEGMMVSPEGWDPRDPEDRYSPSPLEGVVDDEV